MLNSLIFAHKELFLYLHSFAYRTEAGSQFLKFVANDLDLWVVGLSMFFMLFIFYRRHKLFSAKRIRYTIKDSIHVTVAILISWGISYILKISVAAPRPYLRFPDLVQKLFDYGGFDSFPSGHATLFAALAMMFYLYHRRSGMLFAVLAVVISVARVISGVHFPIDILVGWLIGSFVSLLVYKKLDLYMKKILN